MEPIKNNDAGCGCTLEDMLAALLYDTLADESGGGGNTLETLAALGPERYNALSALLHKAGLCGMEGGND